MYEYLRGTLISIEPTYIVLDVQGVGFQLYVANPFQFHSSNQVTQLYVHQVVREDSITLYGFVDKAEKALFLNLISVSGIGPKSALAILASGNHDGLVRAIDNADAVYLTKFPGVGKKTAGQLILDLKGKLDVASAPAENESASDVLKEAHAALIGLGYAEKEIKKIMPVLEKGTFVDTADVLKTAFKLLLSK